MQKSNHSRPNTRSYYHKLRQQTITDELKIFPGGFQTRRQGLVHPIRSEQLCTTFLLSALLLDIHDRLWSALCSISKTKLSHEITYSKKCPCSKIKFMDASQSSWLGKLDLMTIRLNNLYKKSNCFPNRKIPWSPRRASHMTNFWW